MNEQEEAMGKEEIIEKESKENKTYDELEELKNA